MIDGAPDIPVMITFKDMAPSEAVETRVNGRAQKLSRFHERITACRVVIAEAHRQHQKGTLFHVRIDLTVPDGEIVVNREPEKDHAHEDAYVAIRDAFDAAQRQLQNWVGRHAKHGSKTHPTPRHGTVVRVFADEGFGFIETPDGDEVYFHKNAVTHGGWNKLDVGTTVRFCEADGDKGPHAPSVTLVNEGEFVESPPE